MKYLLASGEEIKLDLSREEARFFRLVSTAATSATEAELIALIYGEENPILSVFPIGGRGFPVKKTLTHPLFPALVDLLFRTRLETRGISLEEAGSEFILQGAEAARRIGISRQAVYKYFREGKTPCWVHSNPKTGRPELRFRPADVRAIGSALAKDPDAKGDSLCVRQRPGGCILQVTGGDYFPGPKGTIEPGWKSVRLTVREAGNIVMQATIEPGINDNTFAFHHFSVEGSFFIVDLKKVTASGEFPATTLSFGEWKRKS